jgi:hypothetical protein
MVLCYIHDGVKCLRRVVSDMGPEQTPAETPEEPATDAELIEGPADSVALDAFVELLTPASKAKLLVTLIDLGGHDTNPTDICKKADVAKDAWYAHRDDLEAAGLIEQTRSAGNSPMYRAVMDDPIVQRLEDVYDIAAARQSERMSDGA